MSNFFYFLNSSICIHINLFLYSPVEEHSDYFQLLAIVNKAAMDINIKIVRKHIF